jgi:hypothetical protein
VAADGFPSRSVARVWLGAKGSREGQSRRAVAKGSREGQSRRAAAEDIYIYIRRMKSDSRDRHLSAVRLRNSNGSGNKEFLSFGLYRAIGAGGDLGLASTWPRHNPRPRAKRHYRVWRIGATDFSVAAPSSFFHASLICTPAPSRPPLGPLTAPSRPPRGPLAISHRPHPGTKRDRQRRRRRPLLRRRLVLNLHLLLLAALTDGSPEID